MMTSKVFLVIICSEQIIHRITNAKKFAYIIRRACLSDYIILVTFNNAFVLIWWLVINFVILFSFTPSPSSNEFENFINNLNLTLESITEKNTLFDNPFRWFQCKHNNWCSDDRPTQEWPKTDNVAYMLRTCADSVGILSCRK